MMEKQIYIAEISESELAVRIVEGLFNSKRPLGATAENVLANFSPDDRESFRRAAMKALNYIAECISCSKRPS